MPLYLAVLAYLSLAAQALVVVRWIWLRLGARYAGWAGFSLAAVVIGLYLMSARGDAYTYAALWLWAEPVRQILLSLAVLEAITLLLLEIPAAWRFALVAAGAAVIVATLIVTVGSQTPVGPWRVVAQVNSVAGLYLALVLIAIYRVIEPCEIRRGLALHCCCVAAMVGGMALGDLAYAQRWLPARACSVIRMVVVILPCIVWTLRMRRADDLPVAWKRPDESAEGDLGELERGLKEAGR